MSSTPCAGRTVATMRKAVYKSEAGRGEVEDFYRKLLHKHAHAISEQSVIDTPHGRTHVLRSGNRSDPPLVMIHGSASNSAAWLGALQEFSDRFCVYCVDIPGEPGLSEPVRHRLASEAPARWLSSSLDALNIEKASFVGQSLGGWYALSLAIHHPERVTKLSLLTTSGIVPARRSFLIKVIVLMMLGRLGRRLLSKVLFYKEAVAPEVLEFQTLVSRHFFPLMEEIPLFDDAQLGRISAALQYFGGDHDALIDSEKTGERLKRIVPDCQVNILKETGHVIVGQFSAIKEFLVCDGGGSQD